MTRNELKRVVEQGQVVEESYWTDANGSHHLISRCHSQSRNNIAAVDMARMLLEIHGALDKLYANEKQNSPFAQAAIFYANVERILGR